MVICYRSSCQPGVCVPLGFLKSQRGHRNRTETENVLRCCPNYQCCCRHCMSGGYIRCAVLSKRLLLLCLAFYPVMPLLSHSMMCLQCGEGSQVENGQPWLKAPPPSPPFQSSTTPLRYARIRHFMPLPPILLASSPTVSREQAQVPFWAGQMHMCWSLPNTWPQTGVNHRYVLAIAFYFKAPLDVHLFIH